MVLDTLTDIFKVGEYCSFYKNGSVKEHGNFQYWYGTEKKVGTWKVYSE